MFKDQSGILEKADLVPGLPVGNCYSGIKQFHKEVNQIDNLIYICLKYGMNFEIPSTHYKSDKSQNFTRTIIS